MVFEAHCMSFPCTELIPCTVIIQLCQGKYSFPFYGTFKVSKISIVNVQFCTYF